MQQRRLELRKLLLQLAQENEKFRNECPRDYNTVFGYPNPGEEEDETPPFIVSDQELQNVRQRDIRGPIEIVDINEPEQEEDEPEQEEDENIDWRD